MVTDAQNNMQLDITVNPSGLPGPAYVFYLKAQASFTVHYALTFLRSGNPNFFYESGPPFIAPLFPNNPVVFSDFPNTTPTTTAVFGNDGIQIQGTAFAACVQLWSSGPTGLNCLSNLGNGGNRGNRLDCPGIFDRLLQHQPDADRRR